MRYFIVLFVFLLSLSSCVAVRFPEKIEIELIIPENASPEQIEAVMRSVDRGRHFQGRSKLSVVIDSIPRS